MLYLPGEKTPTKSQALMRKCVPAAIALWTVIAANPAYAQTEDRDEFIRTVLLHPKSSELAPPIIPLEGEETLVLRFDDLSEDFREMSYSFTHCTYDWKPSDLQPMDYLQGFGTGLIGDYDFSFNTLVPYTHFWMEFPNDAVRFTRSGNYLVEVYGDDDPDNVIFTARFMLTEEAASISATVRKSSVVADRNRRQELEVEVNLGGDIQTLNPYDEVKLVVQQNNGRDNALVDLKPRFVKNKQLTYDFHDGLSFDGGNEFHRFDAKSFRYRTEDIQTIEERDGIYHVVLAPDRPMGFRQYSFTNDINGKFLVQNDDMISPHLESDYAEVHFSVPVDAFYGSGELYVYGQLTNWDVDPDFAMTYDPKTMQYHLQTLLKQGYYNYAYLWKANPKAPGSFEEIMGSHSETENDYTIFVYFSDRSTFADRLLAVRTVNSIN